MRRFLHITSFFISHNVPAVYDGLAARISKCVAFAGLPNCGCSEPWEPLGDLGERNPEPPQAAKRKQACYVTYCLLLEYFFFSSSEFICLFYIPSPCKYQNGSLLFLFFINVSYYIFYLFLQHRHIIRFSYII